MKQHKISYSRSTIFELQKFTISFLNVKSKNGLTLLLLLFSLNVFGKESWLEKTQRCLTVYSTILNQAYQSNNADSILKRELKQELKFSKRQIIAALPQLDTLLRNRDKQTKTKSLLELTADKAYFTRSFNGPFGTTMVYRFSKPNEWGLGLAYLSDRYANAYFLKKISENSQSFICDSIVYFVRIYYLHGDSINILSSTMDMYERKVFAPLENSHNWFEKIYTYYATNNDRIENLNYHFSLNYFTEDQNKLGNLLAPQAQSNSLATSDIENFVDYKSLKELSKQNHLSQENEFLDTTRKDLSSTWFYAGTINEKLEWVENFTNLESYSNLTQLLSDSSKHLNTLGVLYARDKPPENYSKEQTKQQSKGKIVGNIFPKDEVFILGKKEVLDYKNNVSIWVKIRSVKRFKM